jgi:hypothetical protein
LPRRYLTPMASPPYLSGPVEHAVTGGKDVSAMTEPDWVVRDVDIDEDIPMPDDALEDESEFDDEDGEPGGQPE